MKKFLNLVGLKTKKLSMRHQRKCMCWP